MEKTATLNLRVNPNVKQRAEEVLSKLGVPMSTAIDMFLNQISLKSSVYCRSGASTVFYHKLLLPFHLRFFPKKRRVHTFL